MFCKSLVLMLSVGAGIFLSSCAHSKYAGSKDSPAETSQGGCDLEFKQSKLCATLTWEKKPSEEDPGSFVLEFHGQEEPTQFAEPVNSVAVVLWMPSMGHGGAPVSIERLGMGQYRVSKVLFLMRGDWEIQVQLKKGSQILDQAVKPIRF